MTDSARRQRRLLAVRELQADFAAAHLRMLRSRQAELQQDLTRWQGLQRIDAHAVTAQPGQWLLACAEQAIAAVRAEGVCVEMDEQAILIETQVSEERERRVAREQMRRLCDRAGAAACLLEERTTQARLDDIFSAARLRRIADAAERSVEQAG